MFVLGLTGSIGMGKTATAKMFADEGIPVQDADAAVHALYEGKATALIEAAFPGTTADGKVDRAKLGAMVIGKPDAMAKLEKIVHPLVARERDDFLTGAEKAGADIVVLDIPLLYETGSDLNCDAVVVVSAPAELQRERVLARPGMTEERFAAILAKQMPDEQKRARADFIVDTSRGFDAARDQVREILRQVRKMANQQ
ncbi:dephospho-CoA kinase [Undibacter mobilis]|uniref:Dephospho-CoA kinase n=1 Tax=Undibacter mobilis TaxID=2292256 RepID=A0A371B936_9BRAD|nr:dephospho-CoA kinase [Undibacter mobilis]RDV04052.1 dephospho-CoA kinase [Undibacter mobilis]